MRTPGAASVTTTRRDGSVIHLTMKLAAPRGVLTWYRDDL
jgi:hypothetical protein